MIYLISGTPGSGKSLHMAKMIWERIELGWPIIANFEINKTRIRKARGDFLSLDNDELTPAYLKQYALTYFIDHKFREGAIWLVIDEAQLLFNAREWDKRDRKEWLSWFTQHRKYGYDVYLIAQFDRMLDRQIRSLIEYEWIHRKVSNYGWRGKMLSAIALGKLFVCVKVWYPLREKVGSEAFVFRKKYSEIYDSYKDFSQDKTSQDKTSQDCNGKKVIKKYDAREVLA